MEIFPGNTEERLNAICLQDHLCAWVDDGKLVIAIDNYELAPDEQFDCEIYEAHTADIYAPANRKMWQFAYRLARTLIRRGSAVVFGCVEGTVKIEIPGTVTISEGVV